MRISDWSSDVCSSDLGGGDGGLVERGDAADAAKCPDPDPDGRTRRRCPRMPRPDDRRTDRRSRVGGGAGEIGRASCRERVCQYVSISVVAVTLKNKSYYRVSITLHMIIDTLS